MTEGETFWTFEGAEDALTMSINRTAQLRKVVAARTAAATAHAHYEAMHRKLVFRFGHVKNSPDRPAPHAQFILQHNETILGNELRTTNDWVDPYMPDDELAALVDTEQQTFVRIEARNSVRRRALASKAVALADGWCGINPVAGGGTGKSLGGVVAFFEGMAKYLSKSEVRKFALAVQVPPAVFGVPACFARPFARIGRCLTMFRSETDIVAFALPPMQRMTARAKPRPSRLQPAQETEQEWEAGDWIVNDIELYKEDGGIPIVITTLDVARRIRESFVDLDHVASIHAHLAGSLLFSDELRAMIQAKRAILYYDWAASESKSVIHQAVRVVKVGDNDIRLMRGNTVVERFISGIRHQDVLMRSAGGCTGGLYGKGFRTAAPPTPEVPGPYQDTDVGLPRPFPTQRQPRGSEPCFITMAGRESDRRGLIGILAGRIPLFLFCPYGIFHVSLGESDAPYMNGNVLWTGECTLEADGTIRCTVRSNRFRPRGMPVHTVVRIPMERHRLLPAYNAAPYQQGTVEPPMADRDLNLDAAYRRSDSRSKIAWLVTRFWDAPTPARFFHIVAEMSSHTRPSMLVSVQTTTAASESFVQSALNRVVDGRLPECETRRVDTGNPLFEDIWLGEVGRLPTGEALHLVTSGTSGNTWLFAGPPAPSRKRLIEEA